MPAPRDDTSPRRSDTVATERIDAHWSRFLGVPVSALRNPGVVVVPHAELAGYRGVWFFTRGRCAVVSAPPEWVAVLERSCGSVRAEALLAPDHAIRALGGAASEIIGPSFQGWLAADRFLPVTSDGVRIVAESESRLIEAAQSSCSPNDWQQGGINFENGDVWASFSGTHVAALGQLRRHFDGAVDPCVITLPAHRGQEHGLRLVGAMVDAALRDERLVLYQTLLSNVPAVSLAHRLGFERYATLLAVRLAPVTPSGIS